MRQSKVELLGREGVQALAPCPHRLPTPAGIPHPPFQRGRGKNQGGTANIVASLHGSEFWFCPFPVAGRQKSGLTLCVCLSFPICEELR